MTICSQRVRAYVIKMFDIIIIYIIKFLLIDYFLKNTLWLKIYLFSGETVIFYAMIKPANYLNWH